MTASPTVAGSGPAPTLDCVICLRQEARRGGEHFCLSALASVRGRPRRRRRQGARLPPMELRSWHASGAGQRTAWSCDGALEAPRRSALWRFRGWGRGISRQRPGLDRARRMPTQAGKSQQQTIATLCEPRVSKGNGVCRCRGPGPARRRTRRPPPSPPAFTVGGLMWRAPIRARPPAARRCRSSALVPLPRPQRARGHLAPARA